jgi:transcriptional regulator with XRE-family HTH domain
MSDNALAIAKELRKIRRGLEISQDSVMAMLGNESHGYISQLERGKREPKLSTLQQWANVLGYQIEVTVRPKEPKE